MTDKSPGALLTIGELAAQLGVATHVLRYWETRFPALQPMQRSGLRRYYRPADVALATRIHHLLHGQGYTVAGAQAALAQQANDSQPLAKPVPMPAHVAGVDDFTISELRRVRDRLARALDRV